MQTLDNYKDKRLKPATNKRTATPRCCGACAYGIIINGFFVCKRDEGWEGDAGDGLQWFRVCDGFVPVHKRWSHK